MLHASHDAGPRALMRHVRSLGLMLTYPSRHANFQKSGLSAVGTAGFLPEDLRFSAQTYSNAPPRPSRRGGRPYVMVADHGVVKTPSSSTVNWSCRCLPR